MGDGVEGGRGHLRPEPTLADPPTHQPTSEEFLGTQTCFWPLKPPPPPGLTTSNGLFGMVYHGVLLASQVAPEKWDCPAHCPVQRAR